MAQVVAKYAAKKMLSKQLQEYKDKKPAGQYDPYYEYRTNPRTGKKKKYKKQIPSYIPEHDADVLARVRKTAYRLDCSLFEIMGIRFGVSSVIALIPVAGDGLDCALALNTVRKCHKIEGGLPVAVIFEMMFWVFIDFVVGLVPFVGDLLDASIKANSRCCRILEKHLDSKYKPKEVTARQKEERDLARRSNIPWHEPAPATVYEDMSDDDALPQYEEVGRGGRPGSSRPATGGPNGTSASAMAAAQSNAGPTRPAPTRTADERRGGPKPERSGSKGFFGGGRSGSKRTGGRGDVEMGEVRR